MEKIDLFVDNFIANIEPNYWHGRIRHNSKANSIDYFEADKSRYFDPRRQIWATEAGELTAEPLTVAPRFSVSLGDLDFSTVAQKIQDRIALDLGINYAPSIPHPILVQQAEYGGAKFEFKVDGYQELYKHLGKDILGRWIWLRTGRPLTNVYAPAIIDQAANELIYVMQGNQTGKDNCLSPTLEGLAGQWRSGTTIVAAKSKEIKFDRLSVKVSPSVTNDEIGAFAEIELLSDERTSLMFVCRFDTKHLIIGAMEPYFHKEQNLYTSAFWDHLAFGIGDYIQTKRALSAFRPEVDEIIRQNLDDAVKSYMIFLGEDATEQAPDKPSAMPAEVVQTSSWAIPAICLAAVGAVGLAVSKKKSQQIIPAEVDLEEAV